MLEVLSLYLRFILIIVRNRDIYRNRFIDAPLRTKKIVSLEIYEFSTETIVPVH